MDKLKTNLNVSCFSSINFFESIKNGLKLNQFASLTVVLYFNNSFLFNPINKEE
jgi:hypothetical protein